MLISPAHPIRSLPLDLVAAALQSRPEGLTSREAAQRLERFTHLLIHMMALLLWAAGAMAFAARTPALGWAIWSVILINTLFAFWQNRPAEGLVPGDHLQLEEGDQVPADCRLIAASQLYLDLSVLTGESLPVSRQPDSQERRPVLPLRSGRVLSRHGEQPQEERVHPSERANLLPEPAPAWPPAGARRWCTPPAPKRNSARWLGSPQEPIAP
ncbi:hypothetical protein [Synechococcus sp. CBW1107]|uniref:P-type ATPase n=1 Tax=Synechococcus sp. CBW1107 TaxID=2789857 RepID=UPI002102C3C5|nr:hypothetical protein [Synechococcus sp. CBW1107]